MLKRSVGSRVKDGNGRLVLEEAEVGRIWKEHYEELYNIDTQEQVAVHMGGLMEFGEATASG